MVLALGEDRFFAQLWYTDACSHQIVDFKSWYNFDIKKPMETIRKLYLYI